MNRDIVDFENLLIQFGRDKDIIKRFFKICINELPERIEKLKQASKDNDKDFLKINAHTIKGIAANMRADSLKLAAENLENVCIENKDDVFDAYLVILEHEFTRLKSEILKDLPL